MNEEERKRFSKPISLIYIDDTLFVNDLRRARDIYQPIFQRLYGDIKELKNSIIFSGNKLSF